MRLLAVIEAASITGPAKNLLEFVRHAAAHDVFTTIATFTRGSSVNQFTDAVSACRIEGLTLETIPDRGPLDPGALNSLRSLIARTRPDILQTHAVKSHFLARLTGSTARVPWVAFHHGYTWPAFRARVYNQLDRWSLRGARRILTVSRPFRDELVAFGIPQQRIEIVHNAISADWGAAAMAPERSALVRSAANIPPDSKVILIVGRLSREKDHLTLLHAVSRIRSAVQAHLVIVGDGPERPRIEERIRSAGLAECVTLTGQQPSAEPWYGIADVAVLSSRSEGSPNALLEAMATGVPVIATSVGGIPEIVAHEESALLIRPGDADSLSAALLRVFTEPGLANRLAESGRRLVVDRYQPEARARKLVAIYREIVAQSS